MVRKKTMNHDGQVKTKGSKVQSSRIEELENALAIANESKLRALADYQNLQRRVEEEKEQLRFLSNMVILSEIIDIIDDFDRAIEHIKSTNSKKAEYEGINALRMKLLKLLERYGVSEMTVKKNDMFDSSQHEAIGTTPLVQGAKDNSIAEVAQKGYVMNQSDNVNVLRNAKVLVYKG